MDEVVGNLNSFNNVVKLKHTFHMVLADQKDTKNVVSIVFYRNVLGNLIFSYVTEHP